MFILEILGTIAFAFSGAMTAIRKEMDIFGVLILGVTTAVGGGIIRDILLGHIPPAVFTQPVYVIVAALIAIALFIWIYICHGQLQQKGILFMEKFMLYADAAGLAVFTVIGVEVSFDFLEEQNLFLSIFVGVVTGVGGGVLRDIMAGQKPYIFVKHVYALSSLVGACICAFLWSGVYHELAVLCGIGAVFIMRILAIYFQWNLPKIKLNGAEKTNEKI